MNGAIIVMDSEPRRAYALKVIAALPLNHDILVTPHIDKRSSDQNARLWVLHQAAAEHVGCGAEEMHHEMLCEFFGCNEVTMPTGHIRRIPLKRSSQRNKKEFATFMEFVESFYITKLGVFLQ